jgi:hypothetical protein
MLMFALDYLGSLLRTVADCREHGSDPSDCIEDKDFNEQLSNLQLDCCMECIVNA